MSSSQRKPPFSPPYSSVPLASAHSQRGFTVQGVGALPAHGLGGGSWGPFGGTAFPLLKSLYGCFSPTPQSSSERKRVGLPLTYSATY